MQSSSYPMAMQAIRNNENTQSLLGNGDAENQNNDNLRSGVKWKHYKEYLNAGYGKIGSFLLLAFFIGVQSSVVYTDYFVSDWANKEHFILSKMNIIENNTLNETFYNISLSRNFVPNRDNYMLQYLIQANVVLFLLLVRPLLYYIMCVKAAKHLFNKLLRAVLSKKYNFFMENTEGDIMNRFNRDQGIIDDTLATTNFDFIQISSFILATFGLSVFVNYFIVVPLAILIVFLLWFRTYYIKIARQLKRLEADERSPLLDLLNAITAGIAIIRSSNKTDEYKRTYNEKMNNYTRVNFPFITAKRWFALRLDLAIVLFIAFIIYGSVLVQNFLENFPITPASIGLLLTYCFQLSTQFQFCVRQSCDAECSMISVERICKYTDKNEYPSESNEETSVNINNWPSEGKIELKNVTFRYNDRSENVFRNLTLTFESGKHVGIIGFNGAGKSSFFNLILRLYEITEGEIVIDNVRLHQTSLSDLRKNITIIPQDPVIFDTTIRENLDPLKMFNDNQINRALESVNLTYSKEQLNDPQEVRHLSKGHKQLLCFARGLLKDTKIYLIDEATSNLSREAENTIRDVIERKLQGKTVLIIAHRIETIKDCDRILGVKGNNQFEYDTPENLKRNDESMYNKFLRGNLTNNY